MDGPHAGEFISLQCYYESNGKVRIVFELFLQRMEFQRHCRRTHRPILQPQTQPVRSSNDAVLGCSVLRSSRVNCVGPSLRQNVRNFDDVICHNRFKACFCVDPVTGAILTNTFRSAYSDDDQLQCDGDDDGSDGGDGGVTPTSAPLLDVNADDDDSSGSGESGGSGGVQQSGDDDDDGRELGSDDDDEDGDDVGHHDGHDTTLATTLATIATSTSATIPSSTTSSTYTTTNTTATPKWQCYGGGYRGPLEGYKTADPPHQLLAVLEGVAAIHTCRARCDEYGGGCLSFSYHSGYNRCRLSKDGTDKLRELVPAKSYDHFVYDSSCTTATTTTSVDNVVSTTTFTAASTAATGFEPQSTASASPATPHKMHTSAADTTPDALPSLPPHAATDAASTTSDGTDGTTFMPSAITIPDNSGSDDTFAELLVRRR